MNNPLYDLYKYASEKYLKLQYRNAKREKKGTHKNLADKQHFQALKQLRRAENRLSWLHAKVGLTATSLIALLSNHSAKAQGYGPFIQNQGLNPLPPPHQIARPKPATVDIDGDGDLDLFVGDKYGNIHFFRRRPNTVPFQRLAETTGSLNPLSNVNKGYWAAPAFADVDGDGDFDLLLGTQSGNTYFFRNVGTATNPNFQEQTGASNPFDGIVVDRAASPVFVDIDKDNDLDLFMVGAVDYSYSYALFFVNDNNAFSGADNAVQDVVSTMRNASLSFADIDDDGDLDILAGNYGQIKSFINKGDYFLESTGPWDPDNKTGNPMYGTYFSTNSTPVFIDYDGDTDLDLFIANGSQLSTPSETDPISFFENTGNFVFEERYGLNGSPFDGLDVGEEASPFFIDLDNDGDLDAIVGSKYDHPHFQVYENNNGVFTLSPNHPIGSVAQSNFFINAKPVLIDIDGDDDLDLFVADHDEIRFFRNNEGSYEEETSPLDVNNLNPGTEFSLAFIDIDGDQDFDAIIGSDGNSPDPSFVQFMRNDGTSQSPDFVAATAPAPFDTQQFEHRPNVNPADIDHDGDIDLIVAETYYSAKYYFTRFMIFENQGDGTFQQGELDLPAGTRHSYMNMADIDGDGDLDTFIGYGEDFLLFGGGQIEYYENQNPAPEISTAPSILTATVGKPIVVDDAITVNDSDADELIQAFITIESFIPGNEILGFTPSGNINGIFDSDTGILHLSGRGTVAEWEQVLRTVTYEFTGSSGGRKHSRVKDLNRTITFMVYDVDFTEPSPASRAVNVAVTNLAPIIAQQTLNVQAAGILSFNLLSIISDPDGNLTPGPSTIEIVQQPSSGASASLEFVSASVVNLNIDYSGITFTGTDQMRIRATDDLDLQTEQDLFIDVSVLSEVVVFNAISPNGDSMNDYLRIDGLTQGNNIVTIYNRWGDEVFKVAGYDNTVTGKNFTGQNKNGKPLPSGNYFYKIENAGKTLTGYLSLKREK